MTNKTLAANQVTGHQMAVISGQTAQGRINRTLKLAALAGLAMRLGLSNRTVDRLFDSAVGGTLN